MKSFKEFLEAKVYKKGGLYMDAEMAYKMGVISKAEYEKEMIGNKEVSKKPVVKEAAAGDEYKATFEKDRFGYRVKVINKEGKTSYLGNSYQTKELAIQAGKKYISDVDRVGYNFAAKEQSRFYKQHGAVKESTELMEFTATIKVGGKKETRKFKSEEELIAYIEKSKGEVLSVKE